MSCARKQPAAARGRLGPALTAAWAYGRSRPSRGQAPGLLGDPVPAAGALAGAPRAPENDAPVNVRGRVFAPTGLSPPGRVPERARRPGDARAFAARGPAGPVPRDTARGPPPSRPPSLAPPLLPTQRTGPSERGDASPRFPPSPPTWSPCPGAPWPLAQLRPETPHRTALPVLVPAFASVLLFLPSFCLLQTLLFIQACGSSGLIFISKLTFTLFLVLIYIIFQIWEGLCCLFVWEPTPRRARASSAPESLPLGPHRFRLMGRTLRG